MRSILFCFGMALTCCTAIAQEEISPKVQSAIYAFHPTTEDVIWETREEALVATFQHPDGPTKVFFDEEGRWLEIRIRKSVHLLPKGVRQYIEEHYQDAHITYAVKFRRPEGETLYWIELELPTEVVVKILSKEGVLLDEERIPFHTLRSYDPSLLPLPTREITPNKRNEM